MPENITFTKASIVSLFDSILNPNPDDSGPIGPGGPVIRDLIAREWLSVMINPQPLPPGPDPFRRLLSILLNPQPLPPGPPDPDPWRSALSWVMLNPQPLPPGPDPYRAALLTRAAIDQAVREGQVAELSDQSERAMEAVRHNINEFVDDYCGSTGPRRWPRPWPGPLGEGRVTPQPVELLAAGVQFQKAADAATESPLHDTFAAAADRLFETAVQRLESSKTLLASAAGQT